MQENGQTPCEQLIPYLTGEGNQEERQAFERHLSVCPTCAQELSELKETWTAIGLQEDEQDVPADLKEEVMLGIFGDSSVSPEPKEAPSRFHPVQVPVRRSGMRPLYSALTGAAAAAAVLLALYALGPAKESGKPAARIAGPAEIVQTYTLKPVDGLLNAGGRATVMKRDGGNEIVVELQGMPPTQGDQAYQVWLLKNGVRYNCGTLVTDEKGSGILTYPVKQENLSFDGIGVTLEPDAGGTQPRGRKVLGTG
ncbi:anti-sigma factor [Paenibacillus sp. CC-CFT747]|nr:anti-sigma factor [Paenibacillus sp. CC-CFT747]